MIDVVNLKKNFGKFPALSDVTMDVRDGEIYGFIGRNGAGKSTTMNILAGLSRPDGGRCLVNGKDVARITHPRELDIGYLPEDPRFFPWMTAEETLLYLSGRVSQKSDKEHVRTLLDWVGLSEAARRRVGGFSRGMRQRLGIAAVLIHDPWTVLLDEPSSALDPEGRSDVLRLISDLRDAGRTILFSTHILDDVQRVCDRVGIIAEGRMIIEKPLRHLLTEYTTSVFDIDVGRPAAALEGEIRQISGVLKIVSDASRLAVTVADARSGAVRLMNHFASRNIAVRSFGLRENTLEEIFIQEVRATC